MTTLPTPPTESEARALARRYAEHPCRCPLWGAFPLRSTDHRAAALLAEIEADHD